jgi:spermidine synthase
VLIGSSIFSFTLILLAFLIGLGVGAAVFARASQRTPHPVRWLAVLHLATAAAVGLTYLFTDRIPYVFTWLLQSSSFGVDAILVCQFVLACVTVLPATILMGGVFPLTVRVAAGALDSVGHDVGNAYALNTLGAIVGSFLSGFIVVPKLGLQAGIYTAVVFDLALAAALFWLAPALARRQRLIGVGAAVALALIGLVLPRWDRAASRRASSACRSRASTSTARSTSGRGRRPSWCSTRTASPRRSASISGTASTR